MSSIEFDSAFNLQVAKSLVDTFSYQSQYIPSAIYHPQITTNGPIQYMMALSISLFGLDLGYAVCLGIIGGVCSLAIYRFSTQAFILYCMLLCLWPLFASTHNAFYGEVFCISMIITGLSNWLQLIQQPLFQPNNGSNLTINFLCRSKPLWFSGIAFGTAIATKLIAIGVIPLLIFPLAIDHLQLYPRTSNQTKLDWRQAFLIWFILPIAIAAIFFLLQFSFSIIHSGGTATTIISKLLALIGEHLHQANKAKSIYDLQQIYLQSYETPVMILLVGACGVLLRKNIVFIIPLFCIATLLLVAHLNLRRMLPLIVPIMLLAIKTKSSTDNSTSWPNAYRKFMPVFIAGMILIGGLLFFHTPLYLIDTLQNFSRSGAPHNIAIVSQRTTYDARLIPLLQNIDGPVFTSRWWQFPEISLRSGITFYDRFVQENKDQITKKGKGYLLFSRKNREDINTEKDLCGAIRFQDGDLILCEYPHDVDP